MCRACQCSLAGPEPSAASGGVRGPRASCATHQRPARRDFVEKTVQALTWFDDATRYRIYWAESNNSPARLWSEWRVEKGRGR